MSDILVQVFKESTFEAGDKALYHGKIVCFCSTVSGIVAVVKSDDGKFHEVQLGNLLEK